MNLTMRLNWPIVGLTMILGAIGVAVIFAATDGAWGRGAMQHSVRIGLGLVIMLGVALTNIKIFYHLAYPIYAIALAMLLVVDVFGVTVNGSQRWLDLGLTRVQPSELIKPAIVLALARYYHDLPDWRVSRVSGLSGAALILVLPLLLIIRQPDLGTTLLVAMTGLSIVFLAGINWRVIAGGILGAAVALPLFVRFGLQDYQRRRIATLFDAASDPSGAGYHIQQSKIALGSGGTTGKGYLQGTQRSGDFVPESRTDFIFTVIGEEFGFVGAVSVMGLYALLMGVCIATAMRVKHLFSKLLVLGLTVTFALYVFINIGMVAGVLPVVGVPLPLISYGGTVVLSVMGAFGLILSTQIYADSELPRGAGR